MPSSRRDSVSSYVSDDSFREEEEEEEEEDQEQEEDSIGPWSVERYVPRWPQLSNYTWLPSIPPAYYAPIQEPQPLPAFIMDKYSALQTKLVAEETVRDASEAALKKAAEAHTRVKETLATLRAWAITDVKRNEEKRLAREVSEEEAKVEAANKEIRILKNDLQPYVEILDSHKQLEKTYKICKALSAPAEDLTDEQKDLLREVEEQEESRRLAEQATMDRLKLYPHRKEEVVVAPVLPEKAPTSWADAVQRAKNRV